MSAPHLRTVTRTQGNNRDLKDGTVVPEGFALDFVEVPVLVQAFRRMVRDLEFDVSEMAFTTYLCARAQGKRFTALPVFLARGFHHGAIVRSTRADITHPKELEDRKVGVNRGYTVTTGVWARAVLQEEYGVDLDQVTWVLSGDEHVAEYAPPPNVAPMPAGSTLDDMLLGGELSAVVGARVDHPDVVPLLPDPDAAAFGALRSRGWYPINHLVVVKDDLLDAHPHLATALFDAFAEAKDRYVERLRDGTVEEPTATDAMYQQVMEVTGEDPLPYGIEPNRAMIEELVGHAVKQHILDAPVPVESLFARGTEHLVATTG
jgi:4,5-dihydroxyphthalate decarboxylase